MSQHAILGGWKLHALALATGLAITALLVLLAWTEVSEGHKRQFETEAGQVWQNAAHKIESNHEALGHLGALFVASMDMVTAEQFHLYSEQLLESHSAAKAAAYMPYLPDKDRMEFEVEQRQKGYGGYAVSQWKNGQYSPAPESPGYFPILHVEPFAVANARMLGFDAMSDPSLKTAIDLAIESSEPVPAQSPVTTDEIWIFRALYTGTETPPAVWRRARVNGLLAIRLAEDKLIDAALLTHGLQADLSIQPQQPVEGNKSPRRQYRMTTPTRQTSELLSKEFRADFPTYSVRMTVSQPWQWRDYDYRMLGVALLAGMAITAIFLALARTASVRARETSLRSAEIERQVELKTQALRESEQRTQMIIAHALDAIVTMNQKSEIVGWNPRAEAMFGWKAAEVLGLDLGDKIVPERHRRAHGEGLKRFLATGKAAVLGKQLEITALHRDGHEFPVELSVSAIATKDGYIFSAFIRDISERKKAQEQLLTLANYDALTGLPNRSLLRDRLTHLTQQAHRAGDTYFGLLVLDLDDFKTINDTLGHTTGDKLLRAAGERITARLRQSDTVARIGGDEFTIIVERLHKADEVVNVATKLIEEFAKPFQVEDREIFTSLSIGITIFPHDGSNADELLRNADTAMYWAKGAGKNRYQFFLREMNERITQRLDLENAMRKAIEREEFLLHYQPQVELATGKVIGMEALIRWNRPEVGLVSPFHFIPVAEDSGLITPIGEWVLRTACRQNMAWREAGLGELRVSVNLSGRQFKQTDLPELVADALRESGLPPHCLELEITESVAMEHAEKTVEILRELSGMDVKIAIDDFGTGYSSLGYLKRFPIDTLKVDRSFVKDITDDPDDAAITSATIAMAHSLKLHVIAEGAETAEQIALLKEYGCDVVQGYFYGRPMPVAEFAKFVEAHRVTQPPVRA